LFIVFDGNGLELFSDIERLTMILKSHYLDSVVTAFVSFCHQR